MSRSDHSIAAVVASSHEAGNTLSGSCPLQHLPGQSGCGSARVLHQHDDIHLELSNCDIVYPTHLFSSDVYDSSPLLHALSSPCRADILSTVNEEYSKLETSGAIVRL